MKRTTSTNSSLEQDYTQAPAPKKAKRAPTLTPSKGIFKPPQRLSLSVLTWRGSPTTMCADGNDLMDYVGAYKEAIRPLKLDLLGWNKDRDAFEYTPSPSGGPNSSTFRYTRETFTETASSDITYYGAIIADNMSPIIRLSVTGQNPWPEKFPGNGGAEEELDEDALGPSVETRNLRGPPFLFFECDFTRQDDNGIHPKDLYTKSILITSPDLPGQSPGDANGDRIGFGDDEAGSGFEQDSTEGMGWRGPWVDALLKAQNNRESLGQVQKAYWSSGNGEGEDCYGAELRLRAIRVYSTFDSDSEESDNEETPRERRAIGSYSIEAQILRVFVKRKWFPLAAVTSG